MNFEMQVFYHMPSDNPYGFVDLGHFNSNFTDLFLIFPDVKFTVTNTIVLQEKDKGTICFEFKRNT